MLSKYLCPSFVIVTTLTVFGIDQNSARAQVLGYSGIEASAKAETNALLAKTKYFREERLSEQQIEEIDHICQFALSKFDALDDNHDGNIDEGIILQARKRSNGAERKMWDVIHFRFFDLAHSFELRGGVFLPIIFQAMSKEDLSGYAAALS